MLIVGLKVKDAVAFLDLTAEPSDEPVFILPVGMRPHSTLSFACPGLVTIDPSGAVWVRKTAVRGANVAWPLA